MCTINPQDRPAIRPIINVQSLTEPRLTVCKGGGIYCILVHDCAPPFSPLPVAPSEPTDEHFRTSLVSSTGHRSCLVCSGRRLFLPRELCGCDSGMSVPSPHGVTSPAGKLSGGPVPSRPKFSPSRLSGIPVNFPSGGGEGWSGIFFATQLDFPLVPRCRFTVRIRSAAARPCGLPIVKGRPRWKCEIVP